jgi:hypothetical protein
MFVLRHALIATLLLLAACGSDDPPTQTTADSPTLSGTATYDETIAPGDVNGKGASGPLRTAANSSGTNQYSISLAQLTAPYMLRYSSGTRDGQQVYLYSVATQSGVANITPLTTLLIAQLTGQNPETAYNAFGAQTSVTDAQLQTAQAKVSTYLQTSLGITVQSATSSFITTPFKTVAGDPMFETLLALDNKLASTGTTLGNLSGQIAARASLCLAEKLDITLDGVATELCPAAKTATPEDDAPTILDYVFTDSVGNKLTLKIQNDTVLSASYVTPSGGEYSCTDAACGTISLGTPNSDLTRSITFTNVQWGGAVVNGTVVGAIPGIALPILPCSNNRFFMIFPDRSVIADCVDVADPLALGGTINSSRGAEPSRATYTFVNSAKPTLPQVQVVTDANDSIVSVYFFQYDPDTFEQITQYHCMLAECNGITLGAVTKNTDLGPENPVLIRNVTFDGTVLAGLNPAGIPINATATLKASFTTVYYVDPNAPLVFPPLMPCAGGYDTIAIDVLSGPFNFCSPPGSLLASDLGNGDLDYLINDDVGYSITVHVRAGALAGIDYVSPVNQTFRCEVDCTGVALSGPDGPGNRTVTFTHVVLHELQDFPRPGPRTAILNSGSLTFSP